MANHLYDFVFYGYDPFGGFSLYWKQNLIARLYYNSPEGRARYCVVCENIAPEIFEDTFYNEIIISNDAYLVDNLTGAIIPFTKPGTNRLFVSQAFFCRGFHYFFAISAKKIDLTA